MTNRIPTLRKDSPAPAPTMAERDIALQQACQAAVHILQDRTRMADDVTPLDAQVPLPESSRRLIRRLAKERQTRMAAEATTGHG